MSEQCTVEGFIFTLPYGTKEIECEYIKDGKKYHADKFMGRSSKHAKTVFEAIKAFKPIPIPEDCKNYCTVTGKPCDPNSWFCHRQFVAIRFFNDRPEHTTKGCHLMRTFTSEWIQALKLKTSEITGVCYRKLEDNTYSSSLFKECSMQHAYANYAHLFFYDDALYFISSKPQTEDEK